MPVPLYTMTLVEPNTTVELSGIIADDRISLGLGSGWRNVAFYMQVRMDTNEIVFNTRDNGKWGTPVTEPFEKNTFNTGGILEVTVDCNERDYYVQLKGKELKPVRFPNRMNIHKTEVIMVGGELEITSFSVKPTH